MVSHTNNGYQIYVFFEHLKSLTKIGKSHNWMAEVKIKAKSNNVRKVRLIVGHGEEGAIIRQSTFLSEIEGVRSSLSTSLSKQIIDIINTWRSESLSNQKQAACK